MNLRIAGLATLVALAGCGEVAQMPNTEVGQVPLSPPPMLGTGVDNEGRPIPFGVPPYFTPDTPLGSGPYKAVMETDPGLPDQVIYRPVNLDEVDSLGIVVWGNGGCVHAGNRFRSFLTELASHGFLVISAGTLGHVALEVGPQENPFVSRPDGPPRPEPSPPVENDPTAPWRTTRSNVEHMREAIDWAVFQATNSESPFYGKLDVEAVGAGGQSCGGGLTTQLAGDERLKAIGIFNAGTSLESRFSRPMTDEQIEAGRQRLDQIHTPTLILTGDEHLDIAYGGGSDTFNYLTDVPVFYAWQEGLGHIGTYGAPNGGSIGRIASDWYAWQLLGDQQAARMFEGSDCILCQEPGWHVQKKNIE